VYMPQRKRPRAPWLAVALIVACLALPAAALAQNLRPDASFGFTPNDPRAGEGVTFTSSACDPDGRLREQVWDLDGDGAFDDGSGRRVTRIYPTQGIWRVGLRVTDRLGRSHERRLDLAVDTEYALPSPDTARLLSPFPVIRLTGRVRSNGAVVRLLSIRAPVCSKVTVLCRGRSCPVKRVRATVGRKRLVVRRFRGFLRRGAELRILVAKGDRIGKFTRFRIRGGRAPSRMDRCLFPGTRIGSRCPQD
jgi:hypothetical protein